ncbi:hypothetical protein Rhal01_01392 [Rubritalea halochordaticola]|uniref:Outer membrane beta-barrel protein n=2 Tax=Rubritalea halochordaticola TaxID=714537 RepID=A0ABP9V3K7_9BACT
MTKNPMITTQSRTALLLMAAAMTSPLCVAGGFSAEEPVTPVVMEQQSSSDWRDWVSATISGSLRYDDNIFLEEDDEESDLIASLAPTLSIANSEDATNQWSFDYTPAARFYFDNSDLDTLDHDVNAKYAKRLPKTSFDAHAYYSLASGSNRYVSGYIDSTNYGLKSNVSHSLSGKTRLDANFVYDVNEFDAENIFDRTKYFLRLGGVYQVTGKINVGPYVSYENIDVVGGVDHEAYGAGAKFEYQATGKTLLTGFFGWENREFNGDNGDDRNAFVYEVGATHQYTAKTRFSGAIYRNSQPSYSSGLEGFETTGINFRTDYQYSEKLSFYGLTAFEVTDYYATQSGTTAEDRDADYFYLRVGANYRYNQDWVFGASTLYRENGADSSIYDYENFQFMVNATYEF